MKEETLKVTLKLERTAPFRRVAVAQFAAAPTAPTRNFSFPSGGFWKIGLTKVKRARQRHRLRSELLRPRVGSYENLPRTRSPASIVSRKRKISRGVSYTFARMFRYILISALAPRDVQFLRYHFCTRYTNIIDE